MFSALVPSCVASFISSALTPWQVGGGRHGTPPARGVSSFPAGPTHGRAERLRRPTRSRLAHWESLPGFACSVTVSRAPRGGGQLEDLCSVSSVPRSAFYAKEAESPGRQRSGSSETHTFRPIAESAWSMRFTLDALPGSSRRRTWTGCPPSERANLLKLTPCSFMAT